MVAQELTERLSDLQLFSVGGDIPGYEPLETLMADMPAEPVEAEGEGAYMLYSSGTTGRPKGVKRPMTRLPMGTKPETLDPFIERYQATPRSDLSQPGAALPRSSDGLQHGLPPSRSNLRHHGTLRRNRVTSSH